MVIPFPSTSHTTNQASTKGVADSDFSPKLDTLNLVSFPSIQKTPRF